MGYGKLDDLYDDNRKIKRAWRRHRASVGLHAQAISYCNRWQTNGLVDFEWLEEKLEDAEERAEVVGCLVDCGLFVPTEAGDGFLVNDFLDHNRSREERQQLHDQRVEAGRKGGQKPRNKRGAKASA